jgi:hypothetical protein
MTVLLEAQAKLYQQFAFDSHSSTEVIKYQSYDFLLEKLKEMYQKKSKNKEQNQQIVRFFVTVTDLFATMFEQPDDQSRYNKLLFTFQHRGLYTLCETLLHPISSMKEKSKSKPIMINLLRIFSALSSVLNEITIEPDEQPVIPSSFLSDITNLFTVKEISVDPEVALRATHCMHMFVKSAHENYTEEYFYQNTRLILTLIEVAILYNDMDNNNEKSSDTQTKRAVCFTAIETLLRLIQKSSTNILSELLERCLTKNVYDLFMKVSDSIQSKRSGNSAISSKMSLQDFFTFVRSDAEHPLFIWNEGMRSELQQFINSWKDRKIDSPAQFWKEAVQNFSFNSINEELVLSVPLTSEPEPVHLFLRSFNKAWQKAKPNSLFEFLNGLASNVRNDCDIRLIESLSNSLKQSYVNLTLAKDTKRQIEDLTLKTSTLLLLTTDNSNVQSSGVALIAENAEFQMILSNLLNHLYIQLNANSNDLTEDKQTLLNNLLNLSIVITKQYLKVGHTYNLNTIQQRNLITVLAKIHRLLQLSIRSTTEVNHPLLQLSLHTFMSLLNILNDYVLAREFTLNHSMNSGMLLTVLYIMSNSKVSSRPERITCAKIIGYCCNQDQQLIVPQQVNSTQRIITLFQSILMSKFQQYLSNAYESPEMLLYYFDEDHRTPQIIWNEQMRQDLIRFLSKLNQEIRSFFEQLVSSPATDTTLTQDPFIRDFQLEEKFMDSYHRRIQNLQVANIFIDSFNENPTYNISSGSANITPAYFMQQLLGYIYVLEKNEQENAGKKDWITQISLWTAVANILKYHAIIQSSGDETVLINGLLPLLFREIEIITLLSGDEEETEQVTKLRVTLLDICFETMNTMLSKTEYQNILLQGLTVQSKRLYFILVLLYAIEKNKVHATLVRQILITILGLLKAGQSTMATYLRNAAVVPYILSCLLTPGQTEENQNKCAEILSDLVAKDNQTGRNKLSNIICRNYLTPKFQLYFEVQPSAFVRFVYGNHSYHDASDVECEWNDEARNQLRNKVSHVVSQLISRFNQEQQQETVYAWSGNEWYHEEVNQ